MTFNIIIPEIPYPIITESDMIICGLCALCAVGIGIILEARELNGNRNWTMDGIMVVFAGVILFVLSIISLLVQIGMITISYGGAP